MKENFLIDFFDSLTRQTCNNFDVVVVNDGYSNFDKLKSKYSMLNILELEYSNTPAKNREYGINYCINNKYDVLVFGDSDDYFSDNRVEFSLKMLKENDIVVNDVSLFNDDSIYEKKYISNRLKDNSQVTFDYIKNKNIFGLSNTALKVKVLNNVIFDKNLVAIDWYLYKKLLKARCSSVFTNKAITYYRQYRGNTLGLNVVNGKYYLWWEKKTEK